jgi:hypothetical protein
MQVVACGLWDWSEKGLARRGEKKGAALLLKCDKLRRERMGSVGKPCIIRIIRLFLTLLIP